MGKRSRDSGDSGAHEASSRAHSSLGEGAAEAAPTAPHATPGRKPHKKTGPEKFWDLRRVRMALAACASISLSAHLILAPWGSLSSDFKINDVDGEAVLPVDIESDFEPPPPPPEKPPENPAGQGTGAVSDGGAFADAHPDVQTRPPTDSGAGDGGADAAPRNAKEIFRTADKQLAGENNVELTINNGVIRKDATTRDAIRALLRRVKGWDRFMGGVTLDPVTNTEWIRISGPSLYVGKTARDIVLVAYNASDADVDKVADTVSHNTVGDRGPMDVGVPGTHAWLIEADHAERVVIRGKPGLLAVVPPTRAKDIAKQLAGTEYQRTLGEKYAVFMKIKKPSDHLPPQKIVGSIVEIPKEFIEARVTLTMAAAGAVDLVIEGDCASAEEATEVAARVDKMLEDVLVRDIPLFGRKRVVDVTPETKAAGKKVRVHALVPRDVLNMALQALGVPITTAAPRPNGSAAAPASSN